MTNDDPETSEQGLIDEREGKALTATYRKQSSPGYRSGSIRARWAEALFALTALAGAWNVVLAFNGVTLASRGLSGDTPTVSEVTSYIQNADGAVGFSRLCTLGLAVAFLAWLSRTVEITPALGAGTPKDSPRWAIGWWFIPIAFLWKPYKVVREVWDRLAIPTRAAHGMLVEAWWLAFILGVLVEVVANAMAATASTWGDIQSGFWVSFGAAALYVAAAVLGFLIVREIQTRADVRAETLSLDGPPAPLPFAAAFGAPHPVVLVESAHAAPATGGPMVQGDQARYCSRCGRPRTDPAAAFCSQCGAKF
jgi:hypothetical protein